MSGAGFRALTRQVAVGQGGLLISEVNASIPGADERLLTFAFDCGSVNREHLERGLETVPSGNLDLLFISHLDADHVNGIDALTAKLRVGAVVLPCLDGLTLTCLACEGAEEGGIKGSVRSFIADPSQWFFERGVKQVLYVRRDGADGTDGAGPFTPDPDRPFGRIPDQGIGESPRGYSIHSSGGIIDMAAKGRPGASIRILGAETAIGASRGSANWLLVPYVHPFDSHAVAAFRRAAAKVLNVPITSDLAAPRFRKLLLGVLADEVKRKALKVCYRILAGDNNKPSMSLFAGPYPDRHSNPTVERSDEGYWYHRHRWASASPLKLVPRGGPPSNRGGAWLCTGDADLASPDTRTAWLRRYANLLDHVEVFVLPHHGSNRSLHDEVVAKLRGAMMVACAAIGRVHHPHPALLGRLAHEGCAVWQVSEELASDFSTEVRG